MPELNYAEALNEYDPGNPEIELAGSGKPTVVHDGTAGDRTG